MPGKPRANSLVTVKVARPICALALAPDGKTVAFGGAKDGRIRLWRGGVLVGERPFATGKQAAYALAFTPDGRQLVVGSSRLSRLDLHSGEVTSHFADQKELHAVAGLDVGADAVAASIGPAVRVWSTSTGRVITTLEDFGWYVNLLRGDGERFVTVAAESKHLLRVWSLATGAPIRNLRSGTSGWIVRSPTKVPMKAKYPVFVGCTHARQRRRSCSSCHADLFPLMKPSSAPCSKSCARV